MHLSYINKFRKCSSPSYHNNFEKTSFSSVLGEVHKKRTRKMTPAPRRELR
ncbi:hypothetical protein SUBVAR_07270 [Subdoligranulum variabile DSM 15176]|uniref:Uncharacterized protein n=1 Tax=Subdoligranulum variabile DSM 15176 TaxID=411471 RepID=D1PS87_9FIRM|nr:hypothetical protein SUBVAR_07270 [Subdoligranulum variabile DSM 15176]